MSRFTYPILFGIVIGTLSRLYMMRTDYRQYPSYLHGKTIHIALGVIAAGLGTIFIPAILNQDYTAITFLTLAASQFRDVRNMERNSLTELDRYELVPRGTTYIEGIAIAFESRNYLVILTSLLTTGAYIFTNIIGACLMGVFALLICKKLKSGKLIKEIVDISFVEPRFDSSGLYVDNIYIMNIGIPERQTEILNYGMGFILKPKSFDARTTIANLGQRQAILHDASTALGIYRDSGTPALTPLAKRDLDDGRVGVFLLPQIKDISKAIKVIGNVPILEAAVKLPTKQTNRKTEGE